jgi:hypothetical protein
MAVDAEVAWDMVDGYHVYSVYWNGLRIDCTDRESANRLLETLEETAVNFHFNFYTGG